MAARISSLFVNKILVGAIFMATTIAAPVQADLLCYRTGSLKDGNRNVVQLFKGTKCPRGYSSVPETVLGQGQTGLTGATGPIGPVGLTGLTGPLGNTGAVGATGVTGLTGATGVAGEAGAVGATGSSGLTGATGVAGEAGAVGATGVAGLTGATGVAGEAGAVGATGVTGLTGATGVAGEAGAVGATGVTGLTGATGVAGATGATGSLPSQNYAYIYNLGAQVVPLESDVTFDTAGVISGFSFSGPSSSIIVNTTGTYSVDFSVSGVEPNQFTLHLNGAAVSGATYGSGAGTQQNVGKVIVDLVSGDILTLRNHTSVAAVTLQTLAGGTQTNSNASIRIIQLN